MACSGSSKRIYLTFDVEVWSKEKNFAKNVFFPLLSIVSILSEQNVPATFFVSVSGKFKDAKVPTEMWGLLLGMLSGLPQTFSVGLHLHVFGLPVAPSKKAETDRFGSLTLEEKVYVLSWAKELFESYGVVPAAFRAGSYDTGELSEYYTALREAGVTVSSSVLPGVKTSLYDFSRWDAQSIKKYAKEHGVLEYPLFVAKVGGRYTHPTPEHLPANILCDILETSDQEEFTINFHSFKVLGSYPTSRVAFVERFLRHYIDKLWNSLGVVPLSLSWEGKNLVRFISLCKEKGFHFCKI